MNKLLAQLPKNLQKLLIKKTMPTFPRPMLATLTKNHFSSKDWIYETKFDGVRCLLFKDKSKKYLKSRNDKSLSDTYPEITKAIGNFKVDQIILDGELVSFQGRKTSFEKMQLRNGVNSPSDTLIKKVKVYLYVFDILYFDGYDLTHLPLITRKNILKKAALFKDPLRYTTHRDTEGEKLYKEACKKGLEGIMAKKRDSTYVHVRSQNWLKFKCVANQELIVCGYTEPQGGRIGFGSLLLGYYKRGKLYYAGKVGTGFSDEFLTSFYKKIKRLEIKRNPFENKDQLKEKLVHFVSPKIVVEIGFEEWTKDNKLRQPRFQGIRDDKKAKDVIRETPKTIKRK